MPDLNLLNFELRQPTKLLMPFIQAIWLVRNTNLEQETVFPVLSDGRMGLVCNFGEPFYSESKGVKHVAAYGCTLSGPSRHLSQMVFKGHLDLVGVRFQPGAAFHFIQRPICDMVDKAILATPSLFPQFHELFEILAPIKGKELIIRAIESFFLDLIERGDIQPDFVLRHLLTQIHMHPDWDLKTLLDSQNISSRDLQRLFKKYIGIPPGVYIRLKKTGHAKHKIAGGKFVSLTGLSQDEGYYDQAHFIRDFKTFMEKTPSSYYKLKKAKKGDGA